MARQQTRAGCPSARWILALACASVLTVVALAQGGDELPLPALVVRAPRSALALPQAVRLALEGSPDLAAIRQQRGLAAAAVVLAQTYPFNPVFEGKLLAANGPPSAGVTNHLVQEYKVNLEVEIRGQAAHRQAAALAGMTRTQWEVAAQEVKLASQVIVAFQEVLYRKEKLRLTDDRLRLAEVTAQQVARLREQGKLAPTDALLARTEVADAQASRQPALLALEKARASLRRAMGLPEALPEPEGPLEGPTVEADVQTLLRVALERRPDLRAKAAAVVEAGARLRLEVANRFGNPSVSTVYEVDPSTVTMIGGRVAFPLPVLNLHQGLIQQRQAEQAKAVAELRQTETVVRLEVENALTRLARAKEGAYTYQAQLLPELQKTLADLQELFEAGKAGVDVLRITSVRRSLLTARGSYLDALWELSQARADLAGAVGDVSLVVGPAACSPEDRVIDFTPLAIP